MIEQLFSMQDKVMLASPASAFITGRIIPIDGTITLV